MTKPWELADHVHGPTPVEGIDLTEGKRLLQERANEPGDYYALWFKDWADEHAPAMIERIEELEERLGKRCQCEHWTGVESDGRCRTCGLPT